MKLLIKRHVHWQSLFTGRSQKRKRGASSKGKVRKDPFRERANRPVVVLAPDFFVSIVL